MGLSSTDTQMLTTVSGSRMRHPGAALISLFLMSFLIYHFLFSPSEPLPPPPPQIPPRHLHVLIPINRHAAEQSSYFCKTLLSTLVHGYEPIVINWNEEGNGSFMHKMKVFGVYEYLKNLTSVNDPESDLVFMMDALDVWLQLSPATLIDRFEELGTAGVVTGAVRACWPNDPDSPACTNVPESTFPKGVYGPDGEPEWSGMPHTRPRWSNSGTVIGSVAAMRELYNDLTYAFQHDEQFKDSFTDQGVFNHFLATRRFSLDYRSRLFWATSFADPVNTAHFINTPYHVDRVIPHDMYPPLLYQTQTGEIPVAVHFDGHTTKGLRDEWWGRFWWNQLQDEEQRFREIVSSRLEGAKVRFAGGDEKLWRDVCSWPPLGV